MTRLVLLRHGESIWNRENRFTGWTDVDLSEKGSEEAHEAGITLKKAGFVFDLCFTSVSMRAIRTLWIVLDFVKHLDSLSAEEIVKLEIPTGIPLVYELDDDLQATGHCYLENHGDSE